MENAVHTVTHNHSPLNEVDMKMWEQKFHRFMSPDELKAQYDRLFKIIGTLDFFYKKGLMFMRDAYNSGKFASIRNSEKVRIVPKNGHQNDCEVIEDGKTYLYELLQLIERDKKKVEEYQNGKPITFVPRTSEEMKNNFHDAINRFRIELKTRETHSTSKESLLLVNFNVFELEDDKPFVHSINKIIQSVDHNYRYISFIRHGKVFRFGKNTEDLKIFYNKNNYL